MITLRKSNDRGHADHGWLQSFHTFSFASYYDPSHIHFRKLRVFNEDIIAGGGGFPTHGHDNMEIITVVISGILEHKDSMGNTAQICPGEVQVMSAGSGITHSEANPSKSEPLHLFQIWLFPKTNDTPPSYRQKDFSSDAKENKWTQYVSPDGADGSLSIDQDAFLYGISLTEGTSTQHALPEKRHGFIHLISGMVVANGQMMSASDAAFVSGEPLNITALEPSRLLLFDLD